MIDDLTNSDTFKVLAATVTGGGFVGWIRERRKGKKDAYEFAMDLLAQQNLRIDALVKDMGRLEARLAQEAGAVSILKEENKELRAENHRLKSALGEHRGPA